jgi:cell division protein FtsI (penicillin-binding protein 3)
VSIKKDILWRVGLVYIGILAFAIVLASKVLFLQFVQHDMWQQKAEEARIKNFIIPSHRGDIYASDMRLLASSVPYYEVRMDMKAPGVTNKDFYGSVDSLAYRLSRLFGDKPASAYKAELVQARKKGQRYYPLKTRVNYLQLKEMKTFPILRKGRYKGGVVYVERSKRIHPHEGLAVRTIGKTTQGEGGNIVGIEGAYDKYLAGAEGIKRMQKISGGIWMPLDAEGEIDPKDGSSVVTSINVDLQDVSHRALLRQLQLQDAGYGTVVVMEVATGDIKAIVNLKKVGDSYKEVYNYAIGASTEPGSTFKLPALITALEDGYVNLTDTIDTGDGTFKQYDITIRDDSYEHGGYGKLTVQQVFEKSSNVGMAKIITGAYGKKPHVFVDRLYSMGLNNPLGIEIKGEGAPMINYPGDKLWSGVSLAQMSYGYELKLTPLQILTFYNAVANNGKMVKPRFVKEIRNHGKIEQTFPPQIINPSICSKATLKKVHQMLEGVVENGTATNLKASSFKIAGKTGTTQLYDSKVGYNKGGKQSYQASFVGYFPASAPRYSCIVVVNAPSRNVYYGNSVAGPVFLEIANKVYATSLDLQPAVNGKEKKDFELPYSKNGYSRETITALNTLGIKTSYEKNLSDWIITQKTDSEIILANKQLKNNLMPNVVSMGVKDALYILENMGLEVEVRGRGSIKKQSIPVGSRVSRGQKVILEMSFVGG